MSRLIAVGATLALMLALTACGAGPHGLPAPDPAPAVQLPPVAGVFDYQLGGASDEVDAGDGPVAIDVVVRDAAAHPLAGAYNVCYVNGFQTQPGEAGAWLDQKTLLLHDDTGALVIDPEWPDEYVLDPRTAAQRDGILEIIGPVIEGCAERGFDAVEIDNLDTWTRFPLIDEDGAHALAAAYVDRAHGAGMAIAQKNAAEITAFAHDELGFDFAVTEECGAWEECRAYTEVYGDHVLQIEYLEALAESGMTFTDACAQTDRAPLTILRDRDLVGPGGARYLYETC